MVALPGSVEALERSTRRRVGTAYGLLVLNVMGYTGLAVHVPSVVGKGITQGALPLAILLLLSVNRRVIVRPNVFLCLVTLLPIEALVTALTPQYLGTVYRTFRLAEFVMAIWLLTPWWGRRDMLLVRYHLVSLSVILCTVLLGLTVAPGHALHNGRLAGALWRIPATQVAHYAAVTTGLVVILWLWGRLSGKNTLVIVLIAGTVLLLTHTRTALAGLIGGLLVAGLSLIAVNTRARRLLSTAGIVVSIGVITISSYIATWLARGESQRGLIDLTGRTKVWIPLLAIPRDRFQEIFGFGLSNSSFNGLPIDSNWLSCYQEQGLVGVSVCAAALLFLLANAYFRTRSVEGALALFLVVYCLIASFTEDGFSDATPYLLEMALAASLLVASSRPRGVHEP